MHQQGCLHECCGDEQVLLSNSTHLGYVSSRWADCNAAAPQE